MIARRNVASPRHKGLTDSEIIQAIEGLTAVNGAGPSYRELADRLGLASTSSVGYRLARMANRGKVTLTRGRSRSVVVADRPHTEDPCPMCVLGTVAREAYQDGDKEYDCGLCLDSKVVCSTCLEDQFHDGAARPQAVR